MSDNLESADKLTDEEARQLAAEFESFLSANGKTPILDPKVRDAMCRIMALILQWQTGEAVTIKPTEQHAAIVKAAQKVVRLNKRALTTCDYHDSMDFDKALIELEALVGKGEE